MSKEVKPARVIEVKVLVPYLIITVLVSVVVGLIGGWFLNVNLTSEARQTFVKDMSVVNVSKPKAQ